MVVELCTNRFGLRSGGRAHLLSLALTLFVAFLQQLGFGAERMLRFFELGSSGAGGLRHLHLRALLTLVRIHGISFG